TGNQANDMQTWEKLIPGISKMDNKDAQGKMYDYMLQNNPDQVKQMWSNYGLTNQGNQSGFLKGLTDNGKFKANVLDNMGNLQQLKSAYVDGMFGARQFDPNAKPTTTPDNSLDGVDFADPFKNNTPTGIATGNPSAGTPSGNANYGPPDH